jgi:hypothetical protein
MVALKTILVIAHLRRRHVNILGALQGSIWLIFHLEILMLDMFAPLLKSERLEQALFKVLSVIFDLKTYITRYRGYVDHSRRAVHAPVYV